MLRTALAAVALQLPLVAGAPAPPTAAQDAPGPPERRWTVDDVLGQEDVGELRFSPDGAWLAWERTRMDEGEGRRRTKLWITRVEDGESWALTRGSGSDRSPRFSPDGRRVAFLSDREAHGEEAGEDGSEGPRVWLLRLGGGEAWPVTGDLRGVRGFHWKGASSDTLVVVARERPRWFERAREDEEDDARAVDDPLEIPPVRLWRVAVGDGSGPGAVERITTNDDWIRGAAVSPDGRRAVTVSGVDPSFQYDAENPPRIHLVDLATGERTEILAGARRERVIPRRMAWSRDGSGFYFSYAYSTHPKYRSATVTRLGFYDLAEGRLERIDLGWERGLGQGFQVTDDGLVALLADGVRDRPVRYRRDGDGWARTPIRGPHASNIWGWRVSPDGRRIAYERSTPDTPPQPYVARLAGDEGARIADPVRVAELNPSLAAKPKPRTEIVTWSGARDEAVEGIVHYPLDYEPGRRYPLVLNIHGGPAGRDADRWGQSWSDPLVLFNQKGAFVLQVNYHGSCCYGLEWVESIAGGSAYYDLPVADIEAGVDHLIERGLVHPDSVATQGWSNGAILSTALTVENPDRYRASLAGAGDVEWISDWANVDFGAAFDQYYFGASPLEDPQRYVEVSPFFELDRVRTPTLIFFGTEDRNVPPSQGWSHFRALQQLDNTEVRFVLFPGEPHGLRELAHQRRKVEEELAWLDRHLRGREAEGPAVVKEGSPLAGLLARADAARLDGSYGVRVGGTLVPETVRGVTVAAELAGLEVGRFEVTRAQWSAFDPGREVPAGAANHPVAGVTFEEARGYAAWLREHTGGTWRLPTEAEARALARSADGGVTLDWWAGYAPGPDDEEALRRRISGAGTGPAPLLLPVGSAPSDADGPGVFDAGGNAAEWAVGEDGSGVSVGPAASLVRGRAEGSGAADPAYRGLRVVREAPGGG